MKVAGVDITLSRWMDAKVWRGPSAACLRLLALPPGAPCAGSRNPCCGQLLQNAPWLPAGFPAASLPCLPEGTTHGRPPAENPEDHLHRGI